MKRIAHMKNWLLALAGGVFVALALIPLQTNAQIADLPGVGIVLAPTTGLIVVLGFVLQSILGLLVAIGAWFIKLVLIVNMQVMSSPMLAAGFKVTLALANLGFVIGIIVIAIMTIVRSQSYGMKKILWKLVFMAIIVNFGLVICGVVLNFSDSLTMYWIDSTSGSKQFEGFAGAVVGALDPQKAFLSTNLQQQNLPTSAEAGRGLFYFFWKDIKNQAGKAADIALSLSTPDGQIKLITASLMGVFGLLISVIVLITFAAMLFIRYLYISILMILLPLAWAAWVFPGFSHYFKQWWDKFLHYAFFPPIVVFFMWLSIIGAKGLGSNGMFNSGDEGSSSIKQAIENTAGSSFAPTIGYALDALIVCGLMLGGLIASQQMGIKFASAGIKAAESASRGLGSYVGRKTGGGFSRRATDKNPKPPKTAFGRVLQSPMNLVRKVAQSDFAEKRGWTEALRQYGQKTDFKRPKELWQKVKKHETIINRANALVQERNSVSNRLEELQKIVPKDSKEKTKVDDEIGKQTEQLRRLAVLEKPLLDQGKSELGISTGNVTDLANKAEGAAKKLREETWESLSSNRGPAGSTFFGALKGFGIYSGKSKLKLSKEQIGELAKASGVDMSSAGAAAPAPPAAPSTP